MLTIADAAQRIFLEKGVTIADPEIKKEFITDIEKAINDRIDAEILARLSEQQLQTLDQLRQDEASAADIREFIKTNITNLPDLVSAAIQDVRNKYLSN